MEWEYAYKITLSSSNDHSVRVQALPQSETHSIPCIRWDRRVWAEQIGTDSECNWENVTWVKPIKSSSYQAYRCLSAGEVEAGFFICIFHFSISTSCSAFAFLSQLDLWLSFNASYISLTTFSLTGASLLSGIFNASARILVSFSMETFCSWHQTLQAIWSRGRRVLWLVSWARSTVKGFSLWVSLKSLSFMYW